MVNIESIIYGDSYKVTKLDKSNNKNILYLKSTIKECECPICHKTSDKYHSTYVRKIQETPINCTETWLYVTAYEFCCNNKKCNNKCFVEELPFAGKHKKMTNNLIQLIISVGMFLSNTCTSLVLSFMGVKVSADTIGRIFSNLEVKDNPDVTKIGIDDVATRKGKKYATAIYNLDDHSMLALLDGRDADCVKEWLKCHKKITHVARDRACSYAKAISEVLPECIQVADRFHLFDNLLVHIKKSFIKIFLKKYL